MDSFTEELHYFLGTVLEILVSQDISREKSRKMSRLAAL